MFIRIYIDSPLKIACECPLDASLVHYLRIVMRQDVGGEVILFNGLGDEYQAEILSLQRNSGLCMVHERLHADRELAVKVFIIQSANRSDKIEHVLQKGTELGAAGFMVCVSDRMQLRLHGEKLTKRLERWHKIIIEAAEQSGRTLIPSIQWQEKITALARPPHPAFYLHPDSSTGLANHFSAITLHQAVTLAIGPEGGWSRRDITCLEKCGFQPLQFGTRVMRTETAAPALLAALQALTDYNSC